MCFQNLADRGPHVTIFPVFVNLVAPPSVLVRSVVRHHTTVFSIFIAVITSLERVTGSDAVFKPFQTVRWYISKKGDRLARVRVSRRLDERAIETAMTSLSLNRWAVRGKKRVSMLDPQFPDALLPSSQMRCKERGMTGPGGFGPGDDPATEQCSGFCLPSP